MITYNGIIEYFKEVANKHTQINSFSFGDIDDADLEKITEYPLLHVGITGAQIDERVISYNINIMLIEIIDDKDNQKENEKYALSNTLQIIQDLQTEFLKGSSIVTPNTKLTGNSLSCQPITGNYNNRVVGWNTLITIEGINESEACNIPYYPITAWDKDQPTPPVPRIASNPYTWYSATEKQQTKIQYKGEEFIKEWTPIIDTANLGDFKGAGNSTSSLVYDFKNKGINIKGINPNSFTIAPRTLASNDTFFITIDQITGGSSTIFTLITNSGGLLELNTSSGSFYIKDSAGNVEPIVPRASFTGLNANSPKLNTTDAIITDRPITVCLKIVASKTVHLYYGGKARAEITTTNTITGLGGLVIGNRLNVQAPNVYGNFNIKEFIYTRVSMNVTEINEVLLWLNKR